MACPDRNKDLKILAELERRKTIVEKVFQREGLQESIEWVGGFYSFQFTPEEEENIVMIEKIGKDNYRAIINTNKK